jgi:hypothetical protein
VVDERGGGDGMILRLYGYFEGDFLGLVIIAVGEQTVGDLAEQLSGWVLDIRMVRTGTALEVLNEAGDLLDLEATIDEAGLTSGDIFTVRQAA